jgi:hypothetical protein
LATACAPGGALFTAEARRTRRIFLDVDQKNFQGLCYGEKTFFRGVFIMDFAAIQNKFVER